MLVKGSTSADFGTHKITIQRGEASALPDIPEPAPQIEKNREANIQPSEPARLLMISGRTFGDSISRIDIWNPSTQTRHSAWCGWDVSLLAPYREIIHDGKVHAIIMGVGPGPIARIEDPAVAVEPGAILVPDGDEFTASVLGSLRDACFRNMPKLLELKAAHEEYRRDAAAWKAANPPRPQNHTIWMKPHRGSRYLTTTTEQRKEGAE